LIGLLKCDSFLRARRHFLRRRNFPTREALSISTRQSAARRGDRLVTYSDKSKRSRRGGAAKNRLDFFRIDMDTLDDGLGECARASRARGDRLQRLLRLQTQIVVREPLPERIVRLIRQLNEVEDSA
jgi:hypothetical protein